MQVCPDLGHAVRLGELMPGAELFGAEDDVWITGCASDPRRVREGELYAALTDNRRAIAEAVERGCAAVLSTASIPEIPVPTCVVPNVRESHARLCQALADNPSRHLKLIGVSGTADTTTTSCLIAGVLAAAGYSIGVLGALGYLDGRIVEDATHVTPPADRLAMLLARMVRNECSHVVVEISDLALEESRLAGIQFDTVCLTDAPVERRGREAQEKIFSHLGDGGLVVLSADDPGSASLLSRLSGPVLTVGVRNAAEITAVPLEQYPTEQTFLLIAGSDTAAVRTHMTGPRHIGDCLAAAAVGLAYGIELPTIIRGLESIDHVPESLSPLP